jgi:hypothetical protein
MQVMPIARRLLAAVTVSVACLLGLVALSQVALCGNVHAECPGTPMWHLESWVADHQSFVLALALAYVVAVFALFGRQIPGALKASIRPRFALRATAYIAAVALLLFLAVRFPIVSALLR